jgi:hypothetical protein
MMQMLPGPRPAGADDSAMPPAAWPYAMPATNDQIDMLRAELHVAVARLVRIVITAAAMIVLAVGIGVAVTHNLPASQQNTFSNTYCCPGLST